jgi:hypothetical protein
MKPRVSYPERPSVELVDPNLPRLDFDEELLPEDSFEVQEHTDEWEVEAILDDRTQRDQRFSRNTLAVSGQMERRLRQRMVE